MRLGVISSHPIQYFSPLYRELTKLFDSVHVLYLKSSLEDEQRASFDPGFACEVAWDVDLHTGIDSRHLGLGSIVSARAALRSFRPVRKWVREHEFDVVLVPGWAPAYASALGAIRCEGTPIVLRPEARPSPSSGMRRAVRDKYVRIFLRVAESYAAIGSVSRAELIHKGADPTKIRMSPYAVDTSWWAARAREASGERDRMRQNLGVNNGTTVFIFVGKFLPYKRPIELIGLFADLVAQGADAHLVMVGEGPLRSQVEELARRSGVVNRVSLPGFLNQSKLPEYLAAADVLVLPSSETWGLVANEAAMFGLPLAVSLDAGCSRDLVADGLTGFRMNVFDRKQTLRDLSTLLDPRKRSQMSANVVELMKSYGLDRAAQGIYEAAALAVQR